MTENALAVTYVSKDRIGVLTLNQPQDRNTMTPALLDGLEQAIDRAKQDLEARVIVLRGTGSCFSAGAHLKVGLQREVPAPLPPVERSFSMYRAFLKILELEVPVIAALQGHAIGGGFGLALVCDIRIAQREAKYGANFVRLGIHPGMGVTYLLPRLIGLQKASVYLYTGELFTGEQGVDLGLFWKAVQGDRVIPEAMTLAQKIADNAPAALRVTKRFIRHGLGWTIKDAAYLEAFAQAMTLQMDDAREGLEAALSKRKPEFKGR